MYKREWTKELEKKAKDELNEIPNKTEEDLKLIKEWLLKNYPYARTDRVWVLNFLRGCKFRIEKTKEKLEYLYKSRSTIPEFYSNRDPLLPELQDILKQCIILPHSTKTEELIIVRWTDLDAKNVSFTNFCKICFMFLDVTLFESSSYLVLGYHLLIDLKGFPFRCVRQLSPSAIKNIAYTLLKAYPIRVKGIYIFNTFPFFPTVFNIVAPLITGKILRRVKVYSRFDLEELSKYISIDNVPKEYGGNSDSVYDIGELWKTHLESYREWFLEDERKQNNTLAKSCNEPDVNSCFKKLSVD